MKSIGIRYWTNLRMCCGSNVGGHATLELKEEDAKLFLQALENFEGGEDMLSYFDKALPQEVAAAVRTTIETSFERVMVGDAIEAIGFEIVDGCGIDIDAWYDMTFEEQIDYTLKVNPGDKDAVDYEIVDIEVNE